MRHDIRWTLEKIERRLNLIGPRVYRRKHPLPNFQFKILDEENLDIHNLLQESIEGWETLLPGNYWAGGEKWFVLSTRFKVPKGWSKDLALYLPIGTAGDFSHPEASVYLDGKLTAACDRHHQEIVLSPSLQSGRDHRLDLIGWSGRLMSWTGIAREELPKRLQMGQTALVEIDKPTREFIALARVAAGVARSLSPDHPTRAHLINSLDEAFIRLDTREPFAEHFYISVEEAHAILQDGISRAGPPHEALIYTVGHAHLDIAWLWPLRQSRAKMIRTSLNVLHLLEQFPDFHFSQSQPQLYEFLRQDAPEIFEAVKEQVASGRWEPIGGMWVEADCNLSGGESLVRQLMLGRAFFREHFGEDSPVLWLPDVFGYAWNLPQLIKQAGLEYFFTIKLGWNQYNRLPYDSFWWQGLDGTRVLTHFSTTHQTDSAMISTYNATATPEEALNTWVNFQQKDAGSPGHLPPLLMCFGHGDGGGGPTREMIENISHMSTFPGTPKLQLGSALEFFQALEREVGDNLPTWNGELYLEYHRGTYTTQARNKQANRRSEFMLHDVEFLATFATTLDPSYPYPYDELQQAWKLVCLNQFHDILPGSSIDKVYKESREQYTQVSTIGQKIRMEALNKLGVSLNADYLLVNPTPFMRRDLAFLPSPNDQDLIFVDNDGQTLDTQRVGGGYLLDVDSVQPYGLNSLMAGAGAQKTNRETPLSITPEVIENDLLRVELNPEGDLTRIFDKENQREILPKGEVGNQFQLFEDRPRTPDAWEIDIYYDDRIWLPEPADAIEVIENGPLRATLEIQRRIHNSRVTQRVSLARGSRRMDFKTRIEWREQNMLLKVAFPVEVLSPTATYEIQWGNVERPTHRNTSWDWARFETCAQKWVDLSEGNNGVSLLNDSKYGHDIFNNVLRLTLLRSPTYPDPQADIGSHEFTYSLLPHGGDWQTETIPEAYALNDPLIVWEVQRPKGEAREALKKESRWSGEAFLSVDQANVVIETVKRAEDGRGIVIRLYECHRARGFVTIRCGFPVKEAWFVNLLEEDIEQLPVDGSRLKVEVAPYKVITLRLIPDNLTGRKR